ncbi:transporter [Halobacteriales archaeon QS_4_66_20]|nr:MAG: transporter [Halobacteriales archaeon QS_4_66_20]
MKIGQTSLVVFISKLVGSALGFVATIYFARVLGAEVIGIYSVIIALVAWLGLAGRLGVSKAIKKRVSEGKSEGEYLAAGTVLLVSSSIILSVLIVLLRDPVERYVGAFNQYSSISVVWFLVLLLMAYLSFSLVTSALIGQRSVHIAGPLRPTRIAVQSVVQVILVFIGFGLVGMLLGYALGTILITLLGIVFVSGQLRKPASHHFRSLLAYAKFSWLGGLKSRAFNDVDILVLGALVPQNLVGIYAVAWSLTKFLDLFGVAVSQTMFPEISNVSAQESVESAAGLIEDSLTYGGFIVIPGVIGGTLLSDRLLRIYSAEFIQGTEVFWLLLLSILFYTYLQQQLNALNAVDRPDAAFRVNIIFVASNVVLNIILIWQIGWVGAAVASVTASGLGLVLSYTLLAQTLPLSIPFDEIGRQWISALLMGGIVWGFENLIESAGLIQHNFATVCLLVGVGSFVYFVFLLAISTKFRATVNRNIPVDPPYPRI